MVSKVFRFKNVSAYKDIIHGISTKDFGSMKNSGVFNKKNVKTFLDGINVSSENLVLQQQTHSANITVIKDATSTLVEDNDGLITSKKDVFIGVVTADCLPVVFYDRHEEIMGVAHAGYKGLSKKIIHQMVDKLKSLGSRPEEIVVGVGPGIGACCYDVSQERIDMFRSVFPTYNDFYGKKGKKYYLDLKKIALFNLLDEGLKESNIEIADICTRDSKDYYSYRREDKETYGEFITVIGARSL